MSLSSEDIVPEYFRGQKDDLTGLEKLWIVEGMGEYGKEWIYISESWEIYSLNISVY